MHQPATGSPVTWARAALLALGVAACGGDDGAGGDATVSAPSAPVTADECVVWLHGRGDRGQAPVVDRGVAHLSPAGNGEWEGGRQWLYATASDLAAATTVVTEAIESAECDRVVLHGFSNGAAFAAKLYCRGSDFDGRLRGVVIDDPVTDASVDGCSPSDRVDAVLYWTTALESQAPAGTACDTIGWTCEGPTVIGVDAYAAALGLPITPSVHVEHRPYPDPPPIAVWLAAG